MKSYVEMRKGTPKEETKDMTEKEILHLILKRLFCRTPDWASWDCESEIIPEKIDFAYNDCFTLTDFPTLHAIMDEYCRQNKLHTKHFMHEPEEKD